MVFPDFLLNFGIECIIISVSCLIEELCWKMAQCLMINLILSEVALADLTRFWANIVHVH